MTHNFKLEILQGLHDLETDTLKVALYTSAATLNPETEVYTTSGETSGSGYTAGGETAANASLTQTDGIVSLSFDDVSWPSASFTAAYALLYNSSKSNRSIAVISLNGDQTPVNQVLTLSPVDPSSGFAVLRIR
jgi:predicted neuraminidase